jgi:glycosyltransferase involved in cell wall biosynthesis
VQANGRSSVLHLGPLNSVHTRRWVENARELGYRVHVAGELPAGSEPTLGDIAESVHVAPSAPRRLNAATRMRWVRHLLRRLRPTLTHAHKPPVWGFVAALAGARPLVVSAWGSDIYLAPSRLRLASRVAVRRAHLVTAPSPDLRRILIAAGASPGRCELIDLGVELETFSPGPAPPEVLEGLGLDPGPVVLSFRHGSPTYRLPMVVESFRRLHDILPSARLAMIGERSTLPGEVVAALDSDLRECASLLAPVARNALPSLFRAATVGVSIPASDGSPLSVWEGLACGLPMVLSDLPQIAERGLEGAAELVPAEPDAVARALAAVVADRSRREAMAAGARRWAEAHADRRQQVALLGEAYERARLV